MDEPNRIIEIIKTIKMAPYYTNDKSGVFHKHEEQVYNYLLNGGLKKSHIVNTKKKEAVFTIDKMELNTFLHQPFGSQNSPDFIVKLDNGLHICIECKSCIKTCYPVYNSGSIHEEYIYIFSSKKPNSTTVFMGRDIITKEQLSVFKETDVLIKQILLEQNRKLKVLDIHKRGWDYYSRRMIGQQGGKSVTDYFEHIDREKCEKKVMDFLKQMNQRIDGGDRDRPQR
jgi:hypothetical protein